MARVGLFRALMSAIADTIHEASGRLVVRTTAAYTAGGASLTVEGTHRWPDSGRIAVGGEIGYYASRTATSLDGITDGSGNPGLVADMRAGSVVMEISRSQSDVDLVRRSFLVAYAEGADLDTLARSYGLARLRGLGDDTWRAVLQVMIYLDAQTIRACTKVLDALLGAGNYELYEDLRSDALTIHVVVDPSAADNPAGRTYLQGGEAGTGVGVTVTVDGPVVEVYGIWDAADPYRAGQNFAMESVTVDTNAAHPRYVYGTWTSGDDGKPITFQGGYWRILAVVDAATVQVGGDTHNDATLNSGTPDVLTTATDWFRSWMVGHALSVAGVDAANVGIFTIAAVLTPRSVQLTAAAFTTESAVTWRLLPQFGTVVGIPALVLRATAVGAVITAPNALPGNVLVDYTTLESAELMPDQDTPGAPTASPFFLWEDGATVVATLDLVKAAGVRVVVETS